MKSCQGITATMIMIILRISGQVQQEKEYTCGRRLVNHKSLIRNGFPSNEGDWPWHAAIFHIDVRQDIEYKCGGTVLTVKSILTAAHCLFENSRRIIPERILVHLGKHNLIISSGNVQEFEVYKVIPHPSYGLHNLHNDIGILRLSTQATFNNYVQPICLWDSNKLALSEVVGKYGTVIGWGITETNGISNILRQATIPVVTVNTCSNSNPSFFEQHLTDKNFCAGYQNGTTICQGDSGGGITFEESGAYYIRGLVSLTASDPDKSLCNTKEYVVFTDVALYLPWIHEKAPEIRPPPSTSGSVDKNDEKDWISSKINCKFGWNNDDKRYECVDETFRSTTDNVRISSIEGSFYDGKSYSDVDTVIIGWPCQTSYIPELSILKMKFVNFIKLYITNSKLKHIERSKLRKLPQLRILNFYGNEIETLQEDILFDLPHLEIFAFVNNRIRILPENLLSKQSKLKELWAWDNKIESIPKNFFKNNKELTHLWFGTNLLKKIYANFNDLMHLVVLDLRGNQCIAEQACNSCSMTFNGIQSIVERDCQDRVDEADEKGWISSTINCKFGWNNDDKRYECVDGTFRSTTDNVRISSVEGSFSDGKSYSDVDTVIIGWPCQTSYIPELSILKMKFVNFIKLYITNSKLKHVERSKLRKLPQLRILNFYGNEIETLQEDILYDLPHLEIFAFVNNRIRILPENLLSKQSKLKELWAWDNKIESIPINFFKNNKELTHLWLASNLLKKIDANFSDLMHLVVLDLRGNRCIDKQACNSCSIKFNEIQSIVERDCDGN